MEIGPWLRVSSDRLEELGVKLETPGYKVSGLSATLWRFLYTYVYDIMCNMEFVQLAVTLLNCI